MLPSFKNRNSALERLDTGEYTEQEYDLWLSETGRINRLLGDASALRTSLRRYALIDGPTSILDVGAGSGELLKVAQETLRNSEVSLVGAELNPRAAKAIRQRKIEFGVEVVQANAMRLPFADRSFDIVICSLFLHHLNDEQCLTLIDEMGRVCRKRVIAIDLHRHPLAYFAYRFFSPLFLQRFTVEDGSLSILRSYKPDELHRLANGSMLKNTRVDRSFPFRLVLTGQPSGE